MPVWSPDGTRLAFNHGTQVVWMPAQPGAELHPVLAPSFDKQSVRDWLESTTVDGKPWGKTKPAPALPAAVVAETSAAYREVARRLGA